METGEEGCTVAAIMAAGSWPRREEPEGCGSSMLPPDVTAQLLQLSVM